ncbi:filamentous hemagglutinin family protein [Microbacteriaceae bacterium K1510]|nr:filamentous hemagglutinin family protein [Microbacteriaceae bacterium K1510]
MSAQLPSPAASSARRHALHAALLAGVSAFAVMAAAPATMARPLGYSSSASASAAAAAAAASQAAQAQAAQVATQVQNSLKRATLAIQAQQATQQAARDAARAAASNVTDGLSAGGLVVDPRVLAGDNSLWQNISQPNQTTSGSQTTVTLTQSAQRAIATWQQFNVGKNTTVYFDQRGGNSWVVLNRIDAAGSPSQIQGQIKAEGTVLLINPNGIIFNGSSQINVHTLIAAAMDFNSFSGTANGAFKTNADASGNYNTSAGAYVPITVNGLSQRAPNGALILAPSDEANANAKFLSNGVFSNGAFNVNYNGSTIATGNTALFSAGNIPGQSNSGIRVEAGASITTDVSGFDNGGFVALLGLQVTNAGSINTSAGQIILAAGSSVQIAEPGLNTVQTSNIVRTGAAISGTLLYAPPAVNGGSLVLNDTRGVLISRRGNITLMGDAVDQFGTAEATTSITRAGAITIVANGVGTAGQVLFGPQSLTSILPEENGETIPSDATSLSNFVGPRIDVVASYVDFQSGSWVLAPSATMAVTGPGQIVTDNPTLPPIGRVLLESGSTIDLSGLTATRSVSDYLYTFKVTANDVADTPLARSLIGQTVTINLALTGTRADGETWVGSPLFASSGADYLKNVAQGIDQLLTKGGTLSFGSGVSAGNGQGTAGFVDVLQAKGAVVNVSGGLIQYTGATIRTSQVLGADGRRYDIGSADPFIAYVGVGNGFTRGNVHWGISQTWTNPLTKGGYYQPSYANGISAGNLSITAINPVLEGDIEGDILIGTHQRALAQSGTGTNGAQATPDQLPQGAALSITLLGNGVVAGALHDAVVLEASAPYVLGPDFSITSTLVLPTATSATSQRPTSVIAYATDRLSAFGLGSITISGADTLSVAAGSSLSVLDGGSIKLGSVSTVDGSLTAHGGSITLAGAQADAGTTVLPDLIIGANALLDVSGRWINDSVSVASGFTGALYINGGSVSLAANNLSKVASPDPVTHIVTTEDRSASIVLKRGSVIDVSSGGYVSTKGKLATGSDGLPKGKGGNLSLTTYAGTWLDDYVDPSGSPSGKPIYAPVAAVNARVVMDGTIYAGGLSQGGTFSLQVPKIVIDGQATKITSTAPGANVGTVVLPTSFFTDSGFGSFKLTSTYGSNTVTAGTTVVLKQQNLSVASSTVLPETGARLRDFAALGYMPDGMRHAVDLTLTQNVYAYLASDARAATATLLIDEGARIVGDPLANISLGGSGTVTVLGSVTAPGGSISVTTQNAWFGAEAVLDVSGTYVPNPLVAAYSTGTVLPGGSITLSSGAMIALAGSVFDISGASGTVEVPVGGTGLRRTQYAPQQLWSDGGSLTISGTSVYFGGTIKAAGGAPSAAGGALAVSANGVTGGSILITQSGADMAAILGGQPTPATITAFIGRLLSAPGTKTTTSSTSNAVVTTGIESFVIPQPSGYTIQGGEYVTLTTVDSGGHTITMVGIVASYDTGSRTLRVNVAGANTARTSTAYSSWTIAIAPKTSFIAADTINTSGLANVSFTGPLNFSGNVAIKVAGSILIDNSTFATILLPQGVFNAAAYSVSPCTPVAICIPSIGGTNVTLEAGYIRAFNAPNTVSGAPSPTLADGTLTLNASVGVDFVGFPSFRNAGTVNIVTNGDVRLIGTLNTTGGVSDGFGGAPWVGALRVPDKLNITAREVYPTTDTAFLLMSLGLAPSGAPGTHNSITFASNGATPVTPLSAGGAIIVDAKTIVQGGALYAPLGTIQLGFGPGQTLPSIYTGGATNNPYDPVQDNGSDAVNPAVQTDSVKLLAGSLTSVSANGLMIPYGTTTDGTDWTDNGTLLNGPPTKLVAFGGVRVETQSGAVIDGSGGGGVYATEFVPGTGGSRNVLTTTAQTVYALVPGYGPSLAAFDPSFTTKVATGQTVTLSGGNGIPAGTYTLLPAEYATLPGAYRVVVVSTNVNPQTKTVTTSDGSVTMTGVLGSAVNGSHSSQTALLQIQSNAVWTKYTQIDVAKGNSYFTALAAANGTAVPRLAEDAARMVVAAGTSLTLNATNRFAPAEGGLGGQLDITGTNLVVAASDRLGDFGTTANGVFTPSSAYAGYLFLDPDMLSRLGIESTLIGGYRGNSAEGTKVTETALNLVIATDAAHALTGPELLFTSLAPTAADPNVRGLVVKDGSVVIAQGKVTGNSSSALVFGVDPTGIFDQTSGALTGWTTGVTGDGSLLRVSNGGLVNIVRHFVPGVYQVPSGTPAPTGPVSTVARGNLSLGNGVTLAGNTLTLDSSGTTIVPLSANLSARNYDLSGAVINLGGGSGGLVVSTDLIGKFAGADTVRLRSGSVFNVYGSNTFGDAANPIGALIFDGAGLYSDGGTTRIVATNITFTNSQQTANTNGANTTGAGGHLVVDASGALVFGAGTKTLAGFSDVTATAETEVLFTGKGGLDAKSASVAMTAPLFLVDAATSQSFATTGALTLAQGASIAPSIDPITIGGALALTGGSINVSGSIVAQGGTLTLEATTGDLTLSGNALLSAAGTRVRFGDLNQDTPGGNIRLVADAGDVKLDAGSTVDVSAAGYGYAGTLTILAANTARLNGALKGGALYTDLGGELSIIADRVASPLVSAGFTRSFQLSVGHGDIILDADQTLTSEKVVLVANQGGIYINGTIDASAAWGGSIQLYGAGTSTAAAGATGASGVTIGSGAKLYARYKAPNPNSANYGKGNATLVQRGGTITLGTTGKSDGTLNGTYGYENVQGSGAITVASGAMFDVSGGSGDGTSNIDTTGGSVIVRAPILTNGSINVSFNGTVVTNAKADGSASGSPLVASAFAVWSTTDASTDPNKHFDGIIDPAGFFNAAGTQIINPTGGLYPTSTAAAPAAGAYLPHVNFYQKTLLDFVNNPFDTNAVAASFAGAQLQVGGNAVTAMPASGLHLRPEIDLVNPTPATGPTSVNSGNITVASNWNFGAGSFDQNGNINLLYRTTNGGEPGSLVLRAANNVKINATISDGFFANYVVRNATADAMSQYNTETSSSDYLAYLNMLNADGLPVFNEYYQFTMAKAAGLSMADYFGIPGLADPFSGTMVGTAEFFGTSASVFSSLQFKLQTPSILSCGGAACSAEIIDQYNQWYAQYVRMFDVYAKILVYNNVLTGQATTGQPGGNYFTRQYLNDLYTAYLGAPPDFSHVVIPAAPTLSGSYYNGTGLLGLSFNSSTGVVTATGSDYSSQWVAYLFNTALAPSIPMFGGSPASSVPTGLSNAVFFVESVSAGFNIPAAPPYAPPAYTTPQAGYVSSISTNPTPPSNQIANNPAFYVSSVGNVSYYNTTSSANLMTAAMSGKGSFSYNFVGGAQFNADGSSPVNPNAVVQASALSPTVTGNVTIDGHTSYANSLSFNNAIISFVPTLVRTGTGSITITAANDFALLDSVASGAVYTAGYVADNAAGFTAPTLPTLPDGIVSNQLVTKPVWATGGGNITVTAGHDIVGIETPVDPIGNQFPGGTVGAGVSTGQFWSAWYYVNGKSTGSAVPFDPSAGGVQFSSWINYGTFFQGFGALGGGNISLIAGHDVKDVSASLPETIQTSGGQSANGPAAALHYYGGGNLLVEAGNDVLSGVYYVGRGTGLIRAGGDVVSDTTLFRTNILSSPTGAPSTKDTSGKKVQFSVPLLLAVQDGNVNVQAAGDIDLGGIFEPTSIPGELYRNIKFGTFQPADVAKYLPSGIGAAFDSYGASSGVSLLSVSGSITVDSMNSANYATLFTHMNRGNGFVGGADPNGIAANLSVTALTGDIQLANSIASNAFSLSPSATGQLSLVAGGSIIGRAISGNGSTNTTTITLPDTAPHFGDDAPALIYAGEDITGGNYVVSKPTRMWAGRDITNLSFTGVNLDDDDITSITAGRDIRATLPINVLGQQRPSNFVSLVLYGPGDLVVTAGRNLGPFSTVDRAVIANNPDINIGGGIFAVGDGSNSVFRAVLPKSYLPHASANITLRYGVAGGIDYAAAIAAYGDAATAATNGVDFLSGVLPKLDQLLAQLIAQRLVDLGASNPVVTVSLTPTDAANLFAAVTAPDADARLAALVARVGLTINGTPVSGLTFNLTPAQFVSLAQQVDAVKLSIDRGFLDLLAQVGKDYNDASSPYAGKYARAYEAIATLFPASLGYTDNSAGGSGAVPTVKHTGDLRMARSLVETQAGGDISILGPGGNAYVGSNSADKLTPAQQGILTLQGGSVRTYTDGSVLIYQSRVFTEQGGNVEMFSANGDLNAGKGPKSAAAYPPLRLICDTDGYCRVNPSGLVTGAGIGALISVPGQDPTKSNVILTAPHGVIDAGAAGIRVAGDAIFNALQILNAFNIQVNGLSVGLPTVASPNIGALTTASNAAGAASQSTTAPQNDAAKQPSVIIVEVLGFGGGAGEDERPANERKDTKRESKLNYDPRGALRILGNGTISSDEVGALTDQERELLREDAQSRM